MHNRTTAREIALHLIFEFGFSNMEENAVNERLDRKVLEALSTDVELYAGRLTRGQKAYILSVVCGVMAQQKALDALIEKHSKGWKLSRLSHMTLALLRLSIYEIRYMEEIPNGVAINEAVELAKKYDTEDAPAFINGVLGTIVREGEDAKQIDAAAQEIADQDE